MIDEGHVITAFLVGAAAAGVMTFLATHGIMQGKHHTDMVERGFAEWVTATDGSTTFKWKEEKPDE